MVFIAYLIPAVIAALLWDHLFYGDSHEKGHLAVEYLLSVLGINLIDFIAVTYFAKSPGNMVEKISGYSNFAVKYILLSVVVAVAVPYLCKYVQSHFRPAVHRGKVNSKIPWRLLAILYTVVLFCLNFARIFDNDFWGDEGYTIRLAKMSVGEMCEATASDVHPPLFYIFEIIGYRLFGQHGWVFHGVALVPYALMLIFFLTVVWKKFGKIPAVLMVTFSSILSSAVTYNVEARMYSWAALFVLLAFYGFYLVLKDGKTTSYLIFILSSLAAAYTHYYAMMTVAFFYLALLVYAFAKKIPWRKVITSYVLTIVGYLPWLFQMMNTFRRTSDSFWMTEVPTFKDSLLYYFATTDKTEWYSRFMFRITLVLLVIGILYSIQVIAFRKKDNKTEIGLGAPENDLSVMDSWLIWGVIASVGTLALGELISTFVRPAFTWRYIYPATAVFWLVFSVSLSRMKSRKVLGIVFVVLTLFVCVPQYVDTYKYEKALDKECQNTAEYARGVISNDDMILTNKTHLAWTIIPYYLPGDRYTLVQNDDYINFKSGTQYWLFWASELSDNDNAWLTSQGYQAEKTYNQGVLGTNTIYIYKLVRESK